MAETPGNLGNLLVSVRATADKFAADMKTVQTASDNGARSMDNLQKRATATLKLMEKGFAPEAAMKTAQGWQTASDKAEVFGQTFKRTSNTAQMAASGLAQTIGIQLPQSVSKFLASSQTIGPLLAGAFSAVAVIGMIQALSQLPALFEKLSGAITGWDAVSKKAYENFLEGNKKAVEAAEEFRLKMIEVQGTGLTGSAKQVVDQLKLNEAIKEQTRINQVNLKTEVEYNELLRKRGALAASRGGFGVLTPDEQARQQQNLANTLAGEKKLRDLMSQRIVEATALNITQGQEAAEAIKKQAEANTKLSEDRMKAAKEHAAFLAKASQEFRNRTFEGGEEVKAGLAAAEKTAQAVVRAYEELLKLEDEAGAAFLKRQQEMNAALEDFRNRTVGGDAGGAEAVRAGEEAAQRTADAIIDAMNKTKQAGQDMIDHFADDVSRMFTGMIAHGQTFWEAFKNLGRSALAAVADTFLSKMIHGFLDPFAAKLGKVLGGASAGGEGGGAGSLLKGGLIAGAIAGVALLTNAVAGLFGKMRKLADEFVQSTQNPMHEAVTDLFDSLEEARSMGTLTVAQVDQASRSFEKMWRDFQASAAAAGVVGQQALATMTPFVASWRTWLDGLEEAGRQLEHIAAVINIRDTVLQAAAGWELMEEAIISLQQQGVTGSQIVEFLGGDIAQLAENLRTLGYAIPPAMQGMLDLIDAMDAITEAADRIRDIDTELQDTFDQLAEALISKLDFLDSQIQQSRDRIAGWSAEIKNLDEGILDQTRHLHDASYWQQQYDNAIQESADNLKRLTDERMSIEKEIVSLQDKIQRDALVKALERAKAQGGAITTLVGTVMTGVTATGHKFASLNQSFKYSGGMNNAAIDAAQAALDAFDAAQAAKAHQADIDRLKFLQEQLPKTIAQQKAAEEAYANASVAAQANIEAQKEAIRWSILQAQQQRTALLNLIHLETLRIAALEADRLATQGLMDAMGISRLSELEKINLTITSLQNRALALIEERSQLELIAGASSAASEGLRTLIATLQAGAAYAPRPPAPNTFFGLTPSLPPVRPPSSTVGPTFMVNIENVHGTDRQAAQQLAQRAVDELNRMVEKGSVRLVASEVKR